MTIYLTELDVNDTDPKKTVADGYDAVSHVYRPDADLQADLKYRPWLAPIWGEKPAGARILDLGCGCGTPTARILAEHFEVTGVDISPVQINRARLLVPHARFILADMTRVSFPEHSFDAVVCLYAIIHVPVAEQYHLLQSIYHWLAESGLALLLVGNQAWTGTQTNWLGVEGATMYWSHTDAKTYKQWFTDIGFNPIKETFVPEGDGGHQMFLLRKGQPESLGRISATGAS